MKKFLSLVLALAMAMSLVVVNTSAKEFTDDEDITYDEAVAVISEIGVVDGYNDGSFNPQGGLTRGAAAKIICNLILGPTTAAELHADTAPYSDVSINNEFAGYIAYCAKEGIISGYADGAFRPANPLTGYAFMKMLLGALGYDANYEQYVGNNWSVNVAKQAIGIGLNKGLVEEFNGVDYVTREEAALYAFNTLKATMVDYENKITANVNGAEVTISNTSAKPVTWSEGINEDGNIKDDSFVQFAEEYFPDLVRADDYTKFMEPANTWTYAKTEIGTYERTDLLVESYTTGVSGRDLYDLLRPGVISANDLEVYVDGQDALGSGTVTNNFYTIDEFDETDLVRSNTDDVGATGDGVLTKVYLNTDKDLITIVSINTWLAQATTDYSESNEYATLQVYYGRDNAATSFNVDVEEVDNVVDVTQDTFYQVNMSWKDNTTRGEVVVLNDVEILEDSTITEYSSDNGNLGNARVTKITTGGEEYNDNVMAFYDEDVLYQYDEGLLTDNTYNIFLDQYGYFLGVELFEGTQNYVFITGFDRNSSNLAVKTATAGAIFLDGTMQNIQVNVTDTDKNIVRANTNHVEGDDNGDEFIEWSTTGYSDPTGVWGRAGKYGIDGIYDLNQWYTYTVDDNGTYTLKPAVRMTWSQYDAKADGSDTIIRTDNLSVRDDHPQSGGVRGYVYGEDATVFLTVDLDVVDTSNGERAITDVNGVYTGVQQVDLVVDTDDPNAIEKGQVFTVFDSDGYVIAAVVIGEAQGNTGNFAYILSSAKSEGRTDGYYYWTFDAVLEGEKQTLTARSNYSSTIGDLIPGTVQELRFDGDYVVGVANPKDLYTNFLVNLDGQDVYVADGRNNTTTANNTPDLVRLQRNTLYVTSNRSDVGLAIASGAKAVVIQDENNKKDVVTNCGTVEQAINYLADPNTNTADKEYKGDIWAVLNSNGAAEWIVFDSETPLITGSQTPGQGTGTDGLLTYSAQNLNGYGFANWTIRTPEYASDGSTVTYAVDVLANGMVVDSTTIVGTFAANSGSQSGNWSGPVFDPDATITLRVRSITANGVAVKYVDEVGQVLYWDSWDDTKDITANTVLAATPSFWAWANGSSSTLSFTVVTDDAASPATLDYAISGLTTNVARKDFATSNTTAQSETVTAAGNDFVVVTIYGLSALNEQFDVTVDTTKITNVTVQNAIEHVGHASGSGAQMSNFGLTGFTADSLVIRFDKVTGINSGEDVKMTAEVSASLSNAVAYNVSVKVNGKTYTFNGLTSETGSDDANEKSVWITNVTGDLKVEDVSVSVAIQNFAIDLTRTTVSADGRDLTIYFNEDVYSAAPLTASDFAVTGASISGTVSAVGDRITLHFNEALADGDTIEVGSTIAGVVTGNNLDASGDLIRINNDGTGYQACTVS